MLVEWKVINRIGLATLQTQGKPIANWAEDALNELDRLLDSIKETDVDGIVFAVDNDKAFELGAILQYIDTAVSTKEFDGLVDRAYQVCEKVLQLPVPTVSAIGGSWLGPSFSFALACTARVMQDSKTSAVGFPEGMFAMFPGMGGTQLLPRLIGYPAFDMIVKGKLLTAANGHELGLVDRVIPMEKDLVSEAMDFVRQIASDPSILSRPTFDFADVDEQAEKSRQAAVKAYRGRKIPGLMLAIDALQKGLKQPLKEALSLEKDCYLKAAVSPEVRGSINTFFLRQKTNKASTMIPADYNPKAIKKIGIIGFGTMGIGIAADILRHMRVPVVVKDNPQGLANGRKALETMLNRLKAPAEELMPLLIETTEYGAEFADVDLVIEAVFENLELKHQIFMDLCAVVKQDCIIASNTSTIPITRLAEKVTNPARFVGAHFFSPVPWMELLEVIRGEQTGQDTIYDAIAFAAAIRKRPLVCNDSPGFVVNALLRPYFITTFELLESGVPIPDIDGAMLSFGMPVGPIRLIEEVGIDVPYNSFKASGLVPSKTLENMVKAGRLGLKKSGKGFFLADGSVDPDALPLIPGQNNQIKIPREEIQTKLFTAFVTEGDNLLQLKVIDSCEAVDMGAIWGLGFPSDKGGPMKWSDLTGLSEKLFNKRFYS